MVNFWKKLKKPILCLAPMAGITDSAFRQVCKSFGANIVYTEMISADGLYYEGKKTLAMLKFNKKEKPIVAQLFGKRPEMFAKAAKICEQYGCDGVDINFGCPAKKVVGHGGGVTLMRDLKLCREIAKNTIKGLKLPVSIKIRAGYKNTSALDLVKAVKDLDIKAIMIHGRTYEQGFSGQIDYKLIKQIKKQFKGILIVNGGINSPQDAKIALKKSGADGIGLARGLYGKPWLFRQINDYLKTGTYKDFNFNQIKKVAIKHAKLAETSKGQHGMLEMRKHLAWYVKGFPGANEMRTKLVRIKTVDEIKKILRI